MNFSSVMSSRTQITLLADEWKSSKGGLSTMNRELARHPNVAVTFFVPKCTEEDKKAASSHDISIMEAKERYGYDEPVDWLSFPPRDLVIDIIIGHGVKLGKQAQVIRESHHCTWVQVVHTAPDKLAIFKAYSGAISKGATSGNEEQVAQKLLEQGLKEGQLTVKEYLKNCDDLAELLSAANLAIIPSRTEGFGLTALEALSAGLPFLVSQKSGFAEALQKVSLSSSWIVNSDDPEQWAKAIKGMREKGCERAVKECQELRTLYAAKYSWEKQCNDLVEMMVPLANGSVVEPAGFAPSQKRNQAENETSERNAQEEQTLAASKGEGSQRVSIESTEHLTGVSKDKLDMPQSGSVLKPEGKRLNGKSQRTSTRTNPSQEDRSATEQRREGRSRSDIRAVKVNTAAANSNQRTRLKEMSPSSTGRTELQVSALEVEPAALVAALQGRSQASDEKSEQTVGEESLTTTRGKLDVVILGWQAKQELMLSVMNLIQKLNLAEDPEVMNTRTVIQLTSYLENNPLKFCMLLVDAEKVGGAVGSSSELEADYLKLLETAERNAGGNVIIVIGGDVNYKNEDEEDRVVISRWAKRKISSQLGEEFLDGRKSFIFSWNKRHRAIHEKALLRYFDQSKKGQKFEYQPQPKSVESNKAAQPPSLRNPLPRGQSMDEQRSEGSPYSGPYNAGQRREDNSSMPTTRANTKGQKFEYQPEPKPVEGSNAAQPPSLRNSLSRGQSMDEKRTDNSFYTSSYSAEQRRNYNVWSRTNSVEQGGEGSLFSRSNIAEIKREASLFDSTTGTTRVNISPLDSEQGARPKEAFSASTGRTMIKDLAILGCNLSENSMQTVRKVFQHIIPKLNLPANPPFENFPLVKVKRYLAENHLKFCVLAVDAETVKDAFGNLSQRRVECQELLITAVNEVEQVVILICDDLPYAFKSKDDETVAVETIKRTIREKGKSFVLWLKNGRMAIDSEVLLEFLSPTAFAPQPHTQTNLCRDLAQERTYATADSDLPYTYVCHPRDSLQGKPSEGKGRCRIM